jgi:hypothetical protein
VKIIGIIIGIAVTLLGAALTAYAIPPASFVALGAIILGVTAMVLGIRMVRGTRHAWVAQTSHGRTTETGSTLPLRPWGEAVSREVAIALRLFEVGEVTPHRRWPPFPFLRVPLGFVTLGFTSELGPHPVEGYIVTMY